jgi:UDP-N-acetylmuramyl pentapeptide phosphotransferase/UDP-N-acetylglucosamine-1-phosphate transferase
VAVGALIALWLVAYVNAYNFMDGINGIAASQAVVAGGLWLFVGEVRHVPVVAAAGALVAAAGIGFLPFNFPTARMFLGDVGSYFIGAWLAAVAVVALRARIPFEAAVAPLAVFAFDTATTLAWRVARGERWYEAHRDHAYQRLIRGGWSHSATTGAATVAMTACALLGAVSLTGSMPLRVAADAALVAVLAGYVAAPALVAA